MNIHTIVSKQATGSSAMCHCGANFWFRWRRNCLFNEQFAFSLIGSLVGGAARLPRLGQPGGAGTTQLTDVLSDEDHVASRGRTLRERQPENSSSLHSCRLSATYACAPRPKLPWLISIGEINGMLQPPRSALVFVGSQQRRWLVADHVCQINGMQALYLSICAPFVIASLCEFA